MAPSFEGFIFGAHHESQFGWKNSNAIDVVQFVFKGHKLSEGTLFLCFMILKWVVIANRFNRLGTYNDPIKDIGAIFKEKCEDVICKGHLDLECERLKPKRLYGKIKIKKLTGSLRRTKYI